MPVIKREPQTDEEAQQQFCGAIPKIYRATYHKAMRGRSLRAAVNAKCQDCTNYQRKEIKDCLVVTCPLYLYHPYQKRPTKR